MIAMFTEKQEVELCITFTFQSVISSMFGGYLLSVDCLSYCTGSVPPLKLSVVVDNVLTFHVDFSWDIFNCLSLSKLISTDLKVGFNNTVRRGGGGYSTKFYTGRLRPEV